jgi:rhodanese-related sulfurtransferase
LNLHPRRCCNMVAQISVTDVKAKLDAGEAVLLLDVRQPEEYELAHLAGCKLIPLGELPSRVGEVEAGTDQPIIVYCHHGVRSLHAAMFLKHQGFTNVSSMSGGIEAWSLQIDPSVRRY